MSSLIKIDQQYEIIKNLGGGLSGEVLLVQDAEGNKAALKFLKKVQMNISREEALKNFKNEFSILKELNHPNISRILDFGFDNAVQKYYFTSEFIHGLEFHKACIGQPIEVIEKLIVQVLRALNYLHSRGIYHFDIKPQNILVYMKDTVPVTAKIIDFGLAGFTAPRKKVGTPSYMAPEVIQGGLLDGRTDLYSMGVLIYRVLTNFNPFASKNLNETLFNQINLKAKPPSSINKSVPKYWDHILSRMLEKNPVNRYSQVSLVIRDLNFLANKNFDVETKDTKLSYLPEKGTLIGRDTQWQNFTELFGQIFLSDKVPEDRLMIIEGHKGSGKTRLLSEIKYFSQLRNIPVKTLRQFAPEEQQDNFILLIDSGQVDADKVNALLQQIKQEKFLIIWATEKAPKNWAHCRYITLNNYDKTQLKQYIESITGLSSAPEKLIEEVYNRTLGNPLFVTEFVKSLIDQGLLFDSSGKWEASTFEDIKIDFNKIHIPNSVEEYLSDKYNRLTHKQKELLQWIAVNHDPLFIEHLAKLTKNKNIHADILQLINDDILEKTSREHTYYFKNLLFADVIYKLINTDKQSQYHEKLAQLYEDNKDEIKNYLFHKGHGKNTKESQKALFDLGCLYLEEPNYEKSISALKQILENSNSPFGSLEINTYFKLGRAYINSRNYDDAIQIYTKLERHLKKSTEATHPINLLKSLRKLVDVSMKKSDLKAAQHYCQEALKIITKNPEQKTYALIFKNYTAFIKLKQNSVDEAEHIYRETQRIWNNELTEAEKEMVDNNRLIEVFILKHEYINAIELCQQNIDVLKKYEKNRFLLAMNYYALGDVYYRYITTEKQADIQKLSQKCIYNLQMCEKISREINDYSMMLRAFNGLGNLYAHEHQDEKALDYYNRALAVSRKTEEYFNAALISYNIGSIHLNSDQIRDAFSYMVYAINTLENLKEQYSPHAELNLYLSYISLSEIYYKNKEYSKAHQTLDKANQIFEETEILKFLEYWKEARRAMIYYGELNVRLGEIFLEKAKSLAKSHEEKEDLNSKVIKYIENDKKRIPQVKTGVKVMNTELAPTSSQDDLKKIIEINKFINSEYDADQLLKIVLNYALQLTNAEAGFVMLLQPNDSFAIKARLNAHESDDEKISMSIAKMAIEKGEIISSSDALSDERFASSDSIVLNELKSVLCLPIRSKNKSIGVFYLDNRFKLNAFDNVDVNLLNAFCDQVGIALENNRLINQLLSAKEQLKNKLDETTEELEQVKDILKQESEVYKTKYAYKHIISSSKTMQEIFRILDKVTETNLSVFIFGESGTGKELVAKALHYNNPIRNKHRFVAINCGAIPVNLMESELFGYKAGSFTGANKDKKGLFEEANGGTLFLDEIGELDSQLQVKLLRVLQESEVQRIGDSQTIKVDVRIVCSSHKDLSDLVSKGLFREDLYYRLCQMKIDIPALRDRSEDIPLLAKHFVQKYMSQNNCEHDIQIPPLFMKVLLAYNWPGNVRELENLISVACALREGNQLMVENIPPNYGIKKVADMNISQSIASNLADLGAQGKSIIRIDNHNIFDATKTWQDYEALIIAKCYELNNRKKMPTAQNLKLSHSTIYKKISDLKLDDLSNPMYAENFIYDENLNMKDYVSKIFQAALHYHKNHPYAAIRQLNISQGYFYKIMKEFKVEEGHTQTVSLENT